MFPVNHNFSRYIQGVTSANTCVTIYCYVPIIAHWYYSIRIFVSNNKPSKFSKHNDRIRLQLERSALENDCCCTGEIATSNLLLLPNLKTSAWKSQYTANLASTLNSRLNYQRPQMLQWLPWCNVEIVTSNSQRPLNVNLVKLHQRFLSVTNNLKYGLFMVAW